VCSGLAVICERPDLIQRVIAVSDAAAIAGCYDIRLFLHGRWTSVPVDAWLPCRYITL
jgi:Calpain family cysteine protease